MTKYMGIKFVIIFIGAATGLSLLLDAVGKLLGGDYAIIDIIVLLGALPLLGACIFILGFLLYQADSIAGKVSEKRRIKVYDRLMGISKR
ncbi:MAG: hypothetical protein ACXACI_00410 [Candidatus Hodarchaeales archaeon]